GRQGHRHRDDPDRARLPGRRGDARLGAGRGAVDPRRAERHRRTGVRSSVGPAADERRGQAAVEHVLIMENLSTTPAPRARRPRPKVVTLTEAAAERVREIMAAAERPYVGLRVGVKNGGCAGQEYVLEYAETADPFDEVVEDK